MATLERFISIPYHGERGEDRWAWGKSNSGATAWVLCDGASESYDAAAWAECLAWNIVNGLLSLERVPRNGRGNLQKLVELWIYRARRIYQRNNQAQLAADDWLSKASQARGSWATLLALRISPRGKTITAWTVGDTELFVLDRYRDILHLPISASEEFSLTPPLIGSSKRTTIPPCRVWHLQIQSLQQPRLILCTDALAAFILTKPDEERSMWWEFITKAPLKAVIDELAQTREIGALVADDYTLLELRL
ncbi:MAG: protein phosphatase 2C domain-containing protein [Treponema sp.]|nr:protein phosphatase 2C domain-containing protein [Treponema sp.]